MRCTCSYYQKRSHFRQQANNLQNNSHSDSLLTKIYRPKFIGRSPCWTRNVSLLALKTRRHFALCHLSPLLPAKIELRMSFQRYRYLKHNLIHSWIVPCTLVVNVLWSNNSWIIDKHTCASTFTDTPTSAMSRVRLAMPPGRSDTWGQKMVIAMHMMRKQHRCAESQQAMICSQAALNHTTQCLPIKLFKSIF